MATLLLSDEMARVQGPALLAKASAAGRSLTLLDVSTAENDAVALAEAECAWFSSDLLAGGPPPSPATRRLFDLVDRAPGIRWLHVLSAGTDWPFYRPALDRGVVLSTSSGVMAVPIAQTVVAALLARARGFPEWLRAQQDRQWRPRRGPDVPPDLASQCAVIVGLGPIGLEVARLLRAVGLRTIGVRNEPKPLPDVDRTVVYADLPSLADQCDWLILCCPLTPRTHRIVDAALLARLPAHAQLINVGRGGLVDEAALIAALQAGRLAGAYLDVFEQEPLPPESPLWSMPSVWISPHNSTISAGNRAREIARFEAQLIAYLAARPAGHA